jgi:hypothetical protein
MSKYMRNKWVKEDRERIELQRGANEESNKPKTTYTERVRRFRERRKTEAARAGDGAVASTYRDEPYVETDSVGGSSEAVGHLETKVGVGPSVGQVNSPPEVPVLDRVRWSQVCTYLCLHTPEFELHGRGENDVRDYVCSVTAV